MPAAIIMENGSQDGVRSDHDHPPVANGSAGPTTDAPVKDSAAVADAGDDAAPTQALAPPTGQKRARMNDLPDEIVHITEGFVPLSLLLSRLAQTTHNSLQDKIAELAKMPMPPSALNGNAGHTGADDASNENMRKKAGLLNFAQEMHGRWVKALVIAEWSRKSEMVSKLIDLKWHIDQQRILYDGMLDQVVNVKRDLTFARMPSPDLKTALQVLSTGSAPWMPDLHYIEPPALNVDDQLKWMGDLDTLLSLRLNLDEFDKIPPQFRNYEIDSGRVTFKVDGEFEVDLTIADEDFDKQFWFIDFRFSFKPAAASIPESLRGYLESCVNEALEKDGLKGCYQFLHEFVLTCKINEIKRQALLLSKASWTGTLKVEPLHRAMAIQYWTSRLPATNPKSWVMVAVNSGRDKKAPEGHKHTTSRLEVKWYQDNKEVADADLAFDLNDLSTEVLLRAVVGRHIESILRGIYDKLLGTPRFKSLERRAHLNISEEDPGLSSLTVQVAHSTSVSLMLEPKTGAFAIKPNSKFTYQQEQKLNGGSNQVEGGFLCLEDVRCAYMEDDISRQCGPVGWSSVRPALKDEEVRSIVKMRDWSRTIWLHRKGWPESWCLMVILGLSGDEWWLVETAPLATAQSQRFQLKLPLPSGSPDLSESFWGRLTIFTTAMISHCIDMGVLHQQRIKTRVNDMSNWPSRMLKLPAIDMSLSAMFPTMVYTPAERRPSVLDASDGNATKRKRQSVSSLAMGPREPWAKDSITLRLKSVEAPSCRSKVGEGEASADRLMCVSEATIKVHKPAKLASIKGRVDDSVQYDSRKGEFTLSVRHEVGEPTLDALKTRIVAVDRFVCFLEALGRSRDYIQSENVSLRHVSFLYGAKHPEGSTADSEQQRWRVRLDLSRSEVDVKLDEGNPHLRVIDLMKRIVNIDGGIGTLMSWLPSSLPTLTAIDAIETRWEEIQVKAQGSVEFTIKTMDWMRIRYTVMGTDKAGQPAKRQLTLEGRIKLRHRQPWWFIWRADSGGNDDRFAAALRHIWDGRGDGWRGLATGAAGQILAGSAAVLEKIDEAIRGLVGNLEGDEGFDVSGQPQLQHQHQHQQPQQPQTQAQARFQPQQQAQAQMRMQNLPAKTGRGPDQAIEIV